MNWCHPCVEKILLIVEYDKGIINVFDLQKEKNYICYLLMEPLIQVDNRHQNHQLCFLLKLKYKQENNDKCILHTGFDIENSHTTNEISHEGVRELNPQKRLNVNFYILRFAVIEKNIIQDTLILKLYHIHNTYNTLEEIVSEYILLLEISYKLTKVTYA